MSKKELKLSDVERKEILLNRREQAIKNYQFLLKRDLDDKNSYKLALQTSLNMQYFADDIKKIDEQLEYYGYTDFTADDIPF